MNLQSFKGTPDSLKQRLKGSERKTVVGCPWHTATQLTSPELRNRRLPFHNYQVAAVLWIARLNSPSTLKLIVSSVKRKLISRNKREDEGVCSGWQPSKLKDTVLQTCSERKDEWAEVVQACQNITCSWFASSRCHLPSGVQCKLQDQKANHNAICLRTAWS